MKPKTNPIPWLWGVLALSISPLLAQDAKPADQPTLPPAVPLNPPAASQTAPPTAERPGQPRLESPREGNRPRSEGMRDPQRSPDASGPRDGSRGPMNSPNGGYRGHGQGRGHDGFRRPPMEGQSGGGEYPQRGPHPQGAPDSMHSPHGGEHGWQHWGPHQGQQGNQGQRGFGRGGYGHRFGGQGPQSNAPRGQYGVPRGGEGFHPPQGGQFSGPMQHGQGSPGWSGRGFGHRFNHRGFGFGHGRHGNGHGSNGYGYGWQGYGHGQHMGQGFGGWQGPLQYGQPRFAPHIGGPGGPESRFGQRGGFGPQHFGAPHSSGQWGEGPQHFRHPWQQHNQHGGGRGPASMRRDGVPFAPPFQQQGGYERGGRSPQGGHPMHQAQRGPIRPRVV